MHSNLSSNDVVTVGDTSLTEQAPKRIGTNGLADCLNHHIKNSPSHLASKSVKPYFGRDNLDIKWLWYGALFSALEIGAFLHLGLLLNLLNKSMKMLCTGWSIIVQLSLTKTSSSSVSSRIMQLFFSRTWSHLWLPEPAYIPSSFSHEKCNCYWNHTFWHQWVSCHFHQCQSQIIPCLGWILTSKHDECNFMVLNDHSWNESRYYYFSNADLNGIQCLQCRNFPQPNQTQRQSSFGMSVLHTKQLLERHFGLQFQKPKHHLLNWLTIHIVVTVISSFHMQRSTLSKSTYKTAKSSCPCFHMCC